MRGLLFGSILLVACASGVDEHEPIGRTSDAIRGGVIDRATDGVVLASPGRGVCTGVVIASNVVLTAAHCFAEDLAAGCATPYPITRARPTITPGARVFTMDGEVPTAIDVVEIIGLDSVDVLCGHDLVALRLEHPLSVTPLVPRLDRAPEVGERVSVVGFGEHRPHDVASVGVRRRRDDARVVDLGGRTTIARGRRIGDFVVDVGACAGDSGGPALDRSGRILGLMSRGMAASCADVTYTRLDRHASWIRGVVARAAAEEGIDPPAWATAPLPRPSEPEPEEPTAPPEASCAAAPPGATSGFSPLFAVILGFFARRRRNA